MNFLELYRGEISALLGALFAATGNTVYRLASEDMDVIPINFLRSVLGFLFFFILVIVGPGFAQILSLSGYVILMLVLSVVFSIAVGDTVYLKAQYYIGVSRASPITTLTPLFTLFAAYFLLGEPLTEHILIGVLLVCGGVYFITQPPKNEVTTPHGTGIQRLGFGLAFLTPLCWTGGYLVLRVAVGELDTITANSVRFFFAILFTGLMSIGTGSIRELGTYHRRTIQLVVLATVFNILLGALFWVDSIKYAGASKAATLGSTAPLFALPLSVVFLGESVSWRLLLGTFMTIIGVWLVF